MRKLIFGAALAGALLTAGPATSSQLVARNARDLHLAVNWRGEALLTYRQAGLLRHVLVWGAVNAIAPRPGARQAQFQIDWTGGSQRYHRAYWPGFTSNCGRYDGPALVDLVAACRAPDGSYWAVQSLRQPFSLDTGYTVSHWRGAIASIETGMAWAYSGRFQVLFGRVTYNGNPVYGFGTTQTGAPTDAFGRLVYVDTFNSANGPGWSRENSFVTHRPTGAFCYGFYPRSGGGPGAKYRVTVEGPGVTPLIGVTLRGSHAFAKSRDAAQQQRAAELLRSWGVPSTDRDCGPVLRMAAKLKGHH